VDRLGHAPPASCCCLPCSAVARWLLATRCHSGVLHGRGQITDPPARPRAGRRGSAGVSRSLPGVSWCLRPPAGCPKATWTLKSTPGAWQPHLAEPRRETSATLLAAGRHLGKRPSDPLAALGGWVGALAPRGAAPWSPARRRAPTPETLTAGPKKETCRQMQHLPRTAERVDPQTVFRHRPGCAQQAAPVLRGVSAA
jgi:hypothetical protein